MHTNRAVPPQGKVAYYRSDGTGRDTYIRQHNGGLLSKDRMHSLQQFQPPKQKKMTFGKTMYNRHPTSFKEGGSNKFPHYVSDGTGRDFYVTSTQGGNSCPFRWRNQTDYRFKNILRNHEPFPSVNPQKIDVFAKTQMTKTSQTRKLTSGYEPFQRTLDRRLSQPKKGLRPPPVGEYFDKNFDITRMTQIRDRSYNGSFNE